MATLLKVLINDNENMKKTLGLGMFQAPAAAAAPTQQMAQCLSSTTDGYPNTTTTSRLSVSTAHVCLVTIRHAASHVVTKYVCSAGDFRSSTSSPRLPLAETAVSAKGRRGLHHSTRIRVAQLHLRQINTVVQYNIRYCCTNFLYIYNITD